MARFPHRRRRPSRLGLGLGLGLGLAHPNLNPNPDPNPDPNPNPNPNQRCSPCSRRRPRWAGQPSSAWRASPASSRYGCRPPHIRLQPASHAVAARLTYGCSPPHIRLQPPPHIRLQPASHTVAARLTHTVAGARTARVALQRRRPGAAGSPEVAR